MRPAARGHRNALSEPAVELAGRMVTEQVVFWPPRRRHAITAAQAERLWLAINERTCLPAGFRAAAAGYTVREEERLAQKEAAHDDTRFIT